MSIMEPMNLGSPPSSPASPNPNFLPAFLMGESKPASPSPAISPGRNNSRTPIIKAQVGYSSAQPTNLRQKLFNQSVSDFTLNNSSFMSPGSEKGGPPKQSLFDTIDSKPKSPIMNSTMQRNDEPATFNPNESVSRIANETLNYSYFNESARGNQTYVSPPRSDRLDTLWVTIFGFMPSSTSIVLAQMANCGVIAEKKYPSQGNWIHIRYSAPHEVSRALLMNGKMISNCIMIGVVPYYNKQEGNKENLERHSMYSSPVSPHSVRSMRSPSLNAQQNANSVFTPQNVPQKSTGLVTKAMEYVFGW